VDVTADFDNAFFIKKDWWRFLSSIEGKFKTFDTGERIHMVVDLIVVRKAHFCANNHREYARDKLLINLIHDR